MGFRRVDTTWSSVQADAELSAVANGSLIQRSQQRNEAHRQRSMPRDVLRGVIRSQRHATQRGGLNRRWPKEEDGSVSSRIASH